MTDWVALALEAVGKAGGSEYFVPGAKVRSLMNSLALASGEDLTAFLRNQGLTFSEFLAGISDVKLVKRPGTDMLVGLEGASFLTRPSQKPSRSSSHRQLRKDVYEALTRVTSIPYHYNPSLDRFELLPEPPAGSIQLPLVSLPDLLDQRREFAKHLQDDELRERLLEALQYSANPLAQYQRELSDLGLAQDWHDFNVNTLTQKLQDWAQEADLKVLPGWFGQVTPRAEAERSTQDILTRLANHMTDEEIRNLNVPFRAVEAFYRSLSRTSGDPIA